MEYTHKIILFSETECQGEALVLFGDINSDQLKELGWWGKPRSAIVVKGVWNAMYCTDNSEVEAGVYGIGVGGYYHQVPFGDASRKIIRLIAV